MSDNNNEFRLIIDRLQQIQEAEESLDNSQLQKLTMLARDGLVSDEEVMLVRAAMMTMQAGRVPTPRHREVLLGMLGKLADFVTSDMSMYNRLRNNLKTTPEPEQGDEDAR